MKVWLLQTYDPHPILEAVCASPLACAQYVQTIDKSIVPADFRKPLADWTMSMPTMLYLNAPSGRYFQMIETTIVGESIP